MNKSGYKIDEVYWACFDYRTLAASILRKAYEGGMRYFDTARAYSDSEEKLGEAFGNGKVDRRKIVIATKTASKTPEGFWKDLDTSLDKLKTDKLRSLYYEMSL